VKGGAHAHHSESIVLVHKTLVSSVLWQNQNEPKLILKHDLRILSCTLAKKNRLQRGPATMVPEAGARLRFAPGGRFVPF
jgi:hypothetical protein